VTTHLLAMPGDPDLDADVDGLTVTAVRVRPASREIEVDLADGFGRFVTGPAAVVAHFPPGDPAARITAVRLAMRLPTMPDEVWGSYVGTLHRWQATATPVRMTTATGRVTLLIADRDDLLPVPSRPDPQGEPVEPVRRRRWKWSR